MDFHYMNKYLLAWLTMLLVSIANGALRDLSYGRHMTELAAHQLSTVSSILLLGIIIRKFVYIFPPVSGLQAIRIGLFWLALTVAFEFLFFHYAGGHSWSVLLANYDILRGRVWVCVLAWIALAPCVFYRIRLMEKQ